MLCTRQSPHEETSVHLILAIPHEISASVIPSSQMRIPGLERFSNFSKGVQLVYGKARFQLSNYDVRAGAFNYFAIELISQLRIMHKARRAKLFALKVS